MGHRYSAKHDSAEYNQNAGQPTAGTQNLATPNTPGIFNYLTVYSVASPTAGGPAAAAAANRIINPFTASPLVLESIGFSDAQAQSIVEARDSSYESASGQAGAAGYSWATQAAGGGAGAAAAFLTGASYRYSADIVAVSADGRAFRRVRIVVDVSRYNPLGAAQGTTTPPAVIVYRKDLTAYGWPLPSKKRQRSPRSIAAWNAASARRAGRDPDRSGHRRAKPMNFRKVKT